MQKLFTISIIFVLCACRVSAADIDAEALFQETQAMEQQATRIKDAAVILSNYHALAMLGHGSAQRVLMRHYALGTLGPRDLARAQVYAGMLATNAAASRDVRGRGHLFLAGMAVRRGALVEMLSHLGAAFWAPVQGSVLAANCAAWAGMVLWLRRMPGRRDTYWYWYDTLMILVTLAAGLCVVSVLLVVVIIPLVPASPLTCAVVATDGMSMLTLGVCIAALKLRGWHVREFFQVRWTRWWKLLLNIVAGVIVMWVLLGLAAAAGLGGEKQAVYYLLRGVTARWELWFLFFAIVVGAPLVEELLFRGVVYQTLRGYVGVWPAVLLSALLFAAAHGEPHQILRLTVMGMVLAYSYERSGTLLVPMGIHAVQNSVAFCMITGLRMLHGALS